MLGILCLFVWNVALAGVPSLLLCLHHDFEVHLESETSMHGHCADEHEHVVSQEVELCYVDDDCTDIELQGGEQIPARLNEMHSVDLPIPAVVQLCYHEVARPVVDRLCSLLPSVRGPPASVHWLTDLYIQKTVLRV